MNLIRWIPHLTGKIQDKQKWFRLGKQHKLIWIFDFLKIMISKQMQNCHIEITIAILHSVICVKTMDFIIWNTE